MPFNRQVTESGLPCLYNKKSRPYFPLGKKWVAHCKDATHHRQGKVKTKTHFITLKNKASVGWPY